MLERWNSHFSTTVEQELFGLDFQLCQDPNSSNLGTTVWDASIVLAKYIEKNSRRGDFSRPKVRGKQVLELGAGMGLAGMALALLGADVAFTDIGDVLPLLQRNVDQNISTAALKLKDAAWGMGGGRVPHLLATVLHMGGPRTQTIVANEFRSQVVHDMFMHQFGCHFAIRKVAFNKMDPNYQHPMIHIYLLKRRKQPLEAAAEEEQAGEGTAADEAAAEGGAAGAAQQEDGAANAADCADQGQREGANVVAEGRDEVGAATAEAASSGGSAERFRTRRQGSMLARAFKDVKL